MEKISRIIPPSSRTKAMDISRSQPGRPGSPALGRPDMNFGRPLDLEDQVSLSTAERAVDMQTPLYKNTKENARAKIVDDLAKKFFESKPTDLGKTSELPLSEEIVEERAPIKTPTVAKRTPETTDI